MEEDVRALAVEMPVNEAALEGTAAHEEAERVLRGELDNCVEYPEAQEYVDYVHEWLAEPLIEVWLSYEDYMPDSGGTADAVGIEGTTLHVIDLKYGMGKVEATDNIQGKLYLLGALETLGLLYEIDTMVFHIVQPRLGWVDRAEYTVEEIREFGEKLKALYHLMLTANRLVPVPGEGQCRWCDAAAVCKPRRDYILAIAQEEFSEVEDDNEV